jgi:hypothetical protein
VSLEIGERFLLEQLREAFVSQIMHGDDAPPRHRAEKARKKVVRTEDHVTVDDLHPEHVGRSGHRSRQPRLRMAPQVECAQPRIGRDVRVQSWPTIRDARVSEEVKLDVVMLRQFVEEKVEVPPDAGEWFVKRPNVDADTNFAAACAREAERGGEPFRRRMA